MDRKQMIAEIENAKTQARASQMILQSLLLFLSRKDPVIVKEALDHAVEMATGIAMHTDPEISRAATSILQAVEHFRGTIISDNRA